MTKLVTFVQPDILSNIATVLSAYQTGTITIDNPTGTLLQPDDLEYDLVVAMAAAYTQYQELINDTGNNNYRAFATGERLDMIADSLGISRESGQKAKATVRFSFSSPLINTKTIFAGTSVYNSAGTATYTFYTEETKVITAGQTFYDVGVIAEADGSDYNNLNIGEIDTLSTPIIFVNNISNISISDGGGDVETDDRFSERIYNTPSRPSTGSPEGFKVVALEQSTELVDAKIIDANNGASPGEVDVYILKRNITDPALHSAANYNTVISLVSNALSSDEVRPLNTSVNVYSPDVKQFSMSVSLKVWQNVDLTNLVTDVQNVITEWRDELRNQLGPKFYVEIIQARIEALPQVVQAEVAVTWIGGDPATPKMSNKQIAFLTAIPSPTIDEYIDTRS